jgi:hypothetical protein
LVGQIDDRKTCCLELLGPRAFLQAVEFHAFQRGQSAEPMKRKGAMLIEAVLRIALPADADLQGGRVGKLFLPVVNRIRLPSRAQ